MKDSIAAPLVGAAIVGGAVLGWLVHRAREGAASSSPGEPAPSEPEPAPDTWEPEPDALTSSASSSTNSAPTPTSDTPMNPIPSEPILSAATSDAQNPNPSTPTTTTASALWLWPVPILNGHRPVVSDGFGSARGSTLHAGVDLMFLRNSPAELASVYRPGTPNGTKSYFMPDDTLVLAASAGRVWSAFSTAHGYQVILDHGHYATLYQHLERLLIPEQRAGPNGLRVDAAHPLGVVGGSPVDPPHLKHLHFELWLGKTPIDPEPMLRGWQLLEVHRLEPDDEVSVNVRGAARTTRDPALWG